MDSFTRQVVAEVDERGKLHGTLTPAPDGSVPGRVTIFYNDRVLATVPVVARAEGGVIAHGFTCHLPPVPEATLCSLEVHDTEGQILLQRLDDVSRGPIQNAQGLGAHAVLSSASTPMFAVPWLSFDGARIIISGAHLPPGGDPSRLTVKMAKGVRYDFAYPLHGPEFGSHFWYWPNADLSGMILTIDLAGSDPDSDPFYFDFIYKGVGPASHPAQTISKRNARLRQRVWIPRTLDGFVGYPRDASQLTRVQTWSNTQSVSFTGYNVFRLLSTVLEEYGVHGNAGVTILDWGCGHGRVTRHFIDGWPCASIVGADIDAENIAWCRANLKRGRFVTVPLLPPSTLESGAFDAVFGISVVTHLTEATQIAWLEELHRILKPGGLALISFGGAGAAAWGSFWHEPAWWDRWRANEFDDGILDPALAGKISEDSYYRITVQSIAWTRALYERFFEVVAVEPLFVGNQDLILLRKR